MGGTGTARVGCSGWMYRHWRGTVYPDGLPQRRWFEHYSAMLDTVEVNNTFYRLPTEAAVEGWAAQAPPGLVYSLKLGAFGCRRWSRTGRRSGVGLGGYGADGGGHHLLGSLGTRAKTLCMK